MNSPCRMTKSPGVPASGLFYSIFYFPESVEIKHKIENGGRRDGVFRKHHLVFMLRILAGTFLAGCRYFMEYYNYRYSFWTAVFQNGETGIDAFWRNNNIELKIIPLRHCS